MGAGTLDPLGDGRANRVPIEEDWPELLHLAFSIRAGAAPPLGIPHRIAAFPRRGALDRTRRGIGRVEQRGILTRGRLHNLELRRRSRCNPGKGEGRHALTRAQGVKPRDEELVHVGPVECGNKALQTARLREHPRAPDMPPLNHIQFRVGQLGRSIHRRSGGGGEHRQQTVQHRHPSSRA
jgi:Tn3 transposase DDE domain